MLQDNAPRKKIVKKALTNIEAVVWCARPIWKNRNVESEFYTVVSLSVSNFAYCAFNMFTAYWVESLFTLCSSATVRETRIISTSTTGWRQDILKSCMRWWMSSLLKIKSMSPMSRSLHKWGFTITLRSAVWLHASSWNVCMPATISWCKILAGNTIVLSSPHSMFMNLEDWIWINGGVPHHVATWHA